MSVDFGDNITGETNNRQQMYPLKNKDVEVQGKYFDIVPDGNLYTLDDSPIFAIRMRPLGINEIIKKYCKSYKFNAKVLTYKLNSVEYSIYTDETEKMYSSQRERMIEYFNFEDLKNDEMRGIVIAITNSDDRLVHALPILYGFHKEKKRVIFLDSCWNFNLGSGAVVGAKFFKDNYKDIDCYCHNETIQADHHSCGIIACDFLKECLRSKAKLARKIIDSAENSVVDVQDYRAGTTFELHTYNLPSKLARFSQVSHRKRFRQSIDEINAKGKVSFETSGNATRDGSFIDDSFLNADEKRELEHKAQEINEKKIYCAHWWFNRAKTLIYRKDPEPYNPEGFVIPNDDIMPPEKKEVNTALIQKGHKYAGWITKHCHLDNGYDQDYWLSIIRGQKEDNILKKMMKAFRNLVKEK